MKKVLLIYPPYQLKEEFGDLSEVGNMQQPLGIGYLGAVLEQAGYEVKIIDAPPLGWGLGQITQEAKKFAPDLIGLSVATVEYDRAAKLARALKKKLAVPIVIGGPHVTALPEEVLRETCFDYGIVGEGEETIVALAKALTDKRRSLVRVKGLVFRQGKKVVRTPPRPFINDLDSLPFPARHLMPPLAAYHPTPATYRQFPVGTIITSRGCPNQCTFCFRGVFGNRWRFRSPANIVEEMEVLVNDFGAREIRFWDDTFNVNPDRVIKICQLIVKRGIKVPWTCLGRVNRVSRKMLVWMKKAGCWQISYGIESGDEQILASIKKGITKEMVAKAIKLTNRVGIQSLGFFILGLPGETEKTMRATIDFAKSLPLGAANFTIATPFPGTELWRLAQQRGFLKGLRWEELLVNLPDRPHFVPVGLTSAQVQVYERQAYKEFYRRPIFLYRQLREIKSVAELKRKLRAFLTIQSL